MASVSVAIMAHQKRAAFVPELKVKLDRLARVVWDDGSNSRWGTGRRALLAYDPAATHHLVVQDDAVIPADLVAGVEAALAHAPDDVPVCLYVGRVRPYGEMVAEYVARADGASWLVMDRLNWGVAIVIPTNVIDELVAWCDRLPIPNYDTRISKWFERRETPVWYPWPSLVDHRESPSLVPGRGHAGRTAHRFIGATASALSTDFSGAVLRLPNADSYQPGGLPMLFKSTKYPDLHIPTINVRFEDGFAEVTRRGAMSYLQGSPMRRRGVRLATDEETAAWREASTPILAVAEPAAVEPPVDAVEVKEPAPAAVPAETTPVEEDPADPANDNEEPAPAEDASAESVPDGTAGDVLAWVGDDVDRAKAAAAAEVEGKGRKTLLADLDRIIGE